MKKWAESICSKGHIYQDGLKTKKEYEEKIKSVGAEQANALTGNKAYEISSGKYELKFCTSDGYTLSADGATNEVVAVNSKSNFNFLLEKDLPQNIQK